ncbi:unnamed protein product [Orchesella dallaii]|uniref:Uncharacterized protein n=1 Tax=Orchesella dallaii TaxID=48710 RepID=A0ABP1R483_9HEXA
MPNPCGAMSEREDEETFKRNKNDLWRCMVVFGGVEAMPDSCKKKVANAMAAYGFLRKLRQEYPEAEVPRHELPSEFLIHPKVRPPMGNTPMSHIQAAGNVWGFFTEEKNSTTVNKYLRENISYSCF